MLVCKRSSKVNREARRAPASTGHPTTRPSRLGDGGPVFLPRRKPSAMAETLLACADAEQVTAYDDVWFAGRPST